MGLIDWRELKAMIKATVARELREVRRIGVGVVARAVLRSAAGGEGMQTAGADLRDGDSPEEVELFEAYGFTSAPLAGAEGVGLTVGGDASHRLLVCVGDRRHRPTDLEGGEVAVYRNATGHRILLKADGSTEITTPSSGPTIVLTAGGDVVITPKAGSKSEVSGAGGLAIGRSGDQVTPDANAIAIIGALAGVVNGVAPGTVTPLQLTNFANALGTIAARPGAVGFSK